VARGDVIEALVTALRDTEKDVRQEACKVLGQMGGKTVTDDVINGILCLGDEGYEGKWYLMDILRSWSSRSCLERKTLSNLLA